MLSAHNLTCRREGCDGVVSEPHPLGKKAAVASVKHCSILALNVLFFRPFEAH